MFAVVDGSVWLFSVEKVETVISNGFNGFLAK